MNPGGRRLDLATGRIPLDERQEEFLAWLCGDRPEGESQNAYAQRAGVTSSTLSKWKKDPEFIRRWEETMREGAAHPDILSRQLQALNVKAMAGDVKAIELYWKLVDRMTPDRLSVDQTTRSAEELSDEELARQLDQARQGLRVVGD